MRLRWTDRARGELLHAIRTIAEERPAAARAMKERIQASLQVAREYPLIGRMVPELEVANIRERIVSPYRILYAVRREEIIVLAVLHERRDLRDLPREEE